MRSIHYCEVCGSAGALKTEIENLNGKLFKFFLCEDCSEMEEIYINEETNKLKYLEKLHGTAMLFNGPHSGAILKNRQDAGLTCTCRKCLRKVSTDVFNIFENDITLPEDLKAEMKRHKITGTDLCQECTEELIRSFVKRIPDIKLPLYISYREFNYIEWEGEADHLNDYVIEQVKKRLKGESLDQLPSIKKSGDLLTVSLLYLSYEDLLKTREKEITVDNKEDNTVSLENLNPIEIAHSAHGMFIYISEEIVEYEHLFTGYGYSKIFYKMLCKAVELGFKVLCFDSAGPRYADFEKIVGKAY